MFLEFRIDGEPDEGSNNEVHVYSNGFSGGEVLLVDGNCGWRACYGASPEAGNYIEQQDQQLRQYVQQVPEYALDALRWAPLQDQQTQAEEQDRRMRAYIQQQFPDRPPIRFPQPGQ